MFHARNYSGHSTVRKWMTSKPVSVMVRKLVVRTLLHHSLSLSNDGHNGVVIIMTCSDRQYYSHAQTRSWIMSNRCTYTTGWPFFATAKLKCVLWNASRFKDTLSLGRFDARTLENLRYSSRAQLRYKMVSPELSGIQIFWLHLKVKLTHIELFVA